MKTFVAGGALCLCLSLLFAPGCHHIAAPAPTVALAEAARDGVILERAGERIAVTTDRRVEEGALLSTPDAGRATLRLDGGSWALLDARTRVRIGAARVELLAGRVWIDARDVEALTVAVPGGALSATAASFAVDRDRGGVHVYCVGGQLTYAAKTSNRLEAGMSVRIADAGDAREEAEAHWDDWTGGLAEPGPLRALEPAGVGELAARRADENGRARLPLLVRRHDVRVRLDRDLALVEIRQTFFNPRSEIVEGIYSVRLPPGAILGHFEINEDAERAGSGDDWLAMNPHVVAEARPGDGAGAGGGALEWAGAGRYRARIDAIAAGKTVTVRLVYSEWLVRHGNRRTWVYPMASALAQGQAPLLGEFSLEADTTRAEAGALEAGMNARVEGGRVILRRSDFRPRGDFALDLLDPADATSSASAARVYRADGGHDDGGGYILVNAEAPLGEPAAALDLVLVADTSAATDPTRLDLEKAIVDGILRQLTPKDRVALLTASTAARPIGAGLAPVTRELTEQLLDGLARTPAAGATDLGASLEQAAALLPTGQGVVVYLGDGRPTVGALSPGGVVDHLARLGHPPRVFAVGIGAEANVDLLKAIATGGGITLMVEDRPAAAHAAYRVLAAAALPTLREVTVDLGPDVDVYYPSGPFAVAAGEPLRVIGRLRSTTAPARLALRGLRDGKPFSSVLALTAAAIEDGGDLRRRWAAARLDNLLARSAGREAVAEIGTRFGLVTPWSALLDPARSAYSPLVGERPADTFVPGGDRDAPPDDAPIALEDQDPEGLPRTSRGASPMANLYALAIGERDEGVRVCFERKAAGHPELSGRVEVKIKIGLGGEVASAKLISTTLRNAAVEDCMLRAIRALRLPPSPDGKMNELVRSWQFDADDGGLGTARRCSVASYQYLAARRALWRERLAGNPGVAGAMTVWREAERACELRSWLDRRSLLDIARPHVGATANQIDFYHRFEGQADVQGYLRREILRAVRTAEDVRAIRAGLALDRGVSAELLDAQIAKASSPAARVKVLRQFLALAPDAIALRVRLLTALEEAHQIDEATGVAWSLRGDPAADADVRQAVGEYFARQKNPGEAARAFSEIVEFAPFDPWARRRLGDLYRAAGRFEDAYREYRTLTWLDPASSALLLLAQAAAGAGRTDEALRLQERLAETTERKEGGGDRSDDVSSWARAWTSVRLASLHDEARARKDAAAMASIAARRRSDGVLTSAGELLIAVTWSHPDARLQLWTASPGDKLEQPAPLQGGAAGIEALRVPRQSTGEYQLAIRRSVAGAEHHRDPVRSFEGELWLLWDEGGPTEKLLRFPIHLGPDASPIELTLRGREATPGKKLAAR